MVVVVKGEGEQVERAGAAKRGKAVVVERRRRRRSGDIVVVKVKGEGEQVERGGADRQVEGVGGRHNSLKTIHSSPFLTTPCGTHP
jgi:hypothetical protein